MAKNRFHGVYYSTRRLVPQGYGILVSVWRCGKWIETDMNTMPWPTRGAAWGQASKLAKHAGLREGLRIKCVDGGAMHVMHDTVARAA